MIVSGTYATEIYRRTQRAYRRGVWHGALVASLLCVAVVAILKAVN